jgi:hypothetical protein
LQLDCLSPPGTIHGGAIRQDADKRFLGASLVPAFDLIRQPCKEALAMRRFIFFVCAIAFAAAPALADDGQVPNRSLARMGLSGMKVLSDKDGSQVRGTSIAIAFSATSGGTTLVSVNSPFSVGNHFAFSAKVSASGGAITGGFAVASAH